MADIFFQFPAVCRIGVFPRGAHVREIVGTSRNPLSSRKPKWAPSAAVFFYTRPHMVLPIPDSLFVAFPVPFVGYLAAPAHGPHQLPDVRYRVGDTELPADNLGDATQGPEVGGISSLQRTPKQRSSQAFSLSLVQQRCSAWGRLHTQSSLALALVGLLPSYDRTQRCTDGYCHVAIRLARLQKANRPESTFLQTLGCPLWSHDH